MKIALKIKLPKKFKAKWLKALRSGKFQQSRNGNLVDDEGYCCLGVAGVVCGVSDKRMADCAFLSRRENGIKVLKTVEKALKQPILDNPLDSVEAELACMNDGTRSFKQISNWIEKHL